MTIFTIGFTERTAENFFEALRVSGVKRLVDIRLNNKSQLAGFAKAEDLKYFCREILNINYIHELRFAPSKAIFDAHRNKQLSWEDFRDRYLALLEEHDWRRILTSEYGQQLDGACFLCSEYKPDKCHRKLLTDQIESAFSDYAVVHL